LSPFFTLAIKKKFPSRFIWRFASCARTIIKFVFVDTLAVIHCNEKPIYVLLFWELRSLSPNFHIYVSVSVLYIPRIGPHIFLQQNRQIDPGNISIAFRLMNVEIGTVAAQFLFWEYLFQIFGIVSLQCSTIRKGNEPTPCSYHTPSYPLLFIESLYLRTVKATV
jgi:hypothetical protein